MTTQKQKALSGFTKGPWKSDGNFVWMKSPEEHDGATVAIEIRPINNGDAIPISEWQANAHLIAAAPELLGACRSMLMSGLLNFSHPQHIGLLRELNDAVDKATGQKEGV